jgi:coproporphyrinogen III oxidase
MLGALQRQCCSRVGAAAAVGVGLGVSAGLAGFRSAAGPAQCDAAEQQSPSLGRTEVHELAQGLQQQFVLRLEALATADGIDSAGDFHPVSWLRDEGRHGGGTRYELQNTPLFNRASVNVSSVHYADMPKYPVKSATALSMILHPSNPHAPSMHLHVSYMEPNGRPPYWRMIADLNPSIEDPAATERFEAAMRAAMPATLYADSKLFGDRYFYIPDLDRHRGAAHVFVGALGAGDIAGMSTGQCAALAERFASSALETYCAIVQEALDTHEESAITAEDRATQLAYHTLYFFQVLTLDRGTTHGVLAHNQNDVGTLGSLPSRIDPELLAAWGRCVCAFSLVTCVHEGRACAIHRAMNNTESACPACLPVGACVRACVRACAGRKSLHLGTSWLQRCLRRCQWTAQAS